MTQPRLVGGRYELGELIGYGGMAEVHRGHDARLGREVAIKVLRADLARDPSFLARFRREAQAAAGLNHPSIVSVYDTGEDVTADGSPLPYIVMEYVEGRTLRDVLKAEGRLPIRRAMEVTADVCSALDFSHRNGIVHRDIKPANVMITPAGAVKVMDFGIARALADNAATVTQTANVIGTAQYLSPEQARGEAVDARSDVYSTGCLLYELVTGSPPFQGDSPVAVAYQHVRENASAPSSRNPEVPPALDSIVMKALAKNQLNRYQTAGEMRADLQRALANQPVAAEAVMTDAERTQFIARTPVPPVALGPRSDSFNDEPNDSRRSGLIWVAIVVALLLVIGGAAWAVTLIGKSDKVTTVAVPSLYGETPAAASAQLSALGFDPKPLPATNGTCDGNQTQLKGKVCVQNPVSLDGDTKLKKGSTVTYAVYTPVVKTVPNVIGKSFNDASDAIHTAGFVAPKSKSVDSSQPEGTVTAQSVPAYTQTSPTTVITLSVSTGKVKLPDETGKKEVDARKALNAAGWANINPSISTTTHDKSKAGKVASQSPTGGIAYPQTTAITLTIYRYVPLAPTCTTVPPSSSGGASGSGAPSGGASSGAGLPSGSTASSGSALPPCTSSSS